MNRILERQLRARHCCSRGQARHFQKVLTAMGKRSYVVKQREHGGVSGCACFYGRRKRWKGGVQPTRRGKTSTSAVDKPEVSENSKKVCERREQAQKLGCFMSRKSGEGCDVIRFALFALLLLCIFVSPYINYMSHNCYNDVHAFWACHWMNVDKCTQLVSSSR